MTDQELKDIVAAVVAELEKSGVDFDYKAEPAEDGDLVFVIRGTAPNYQGVTVTWKGLLDIITAQATQAKNDAETAKNAANAILTQVTSKGTEITNFVATSKTEIETQKNESVNAVKSVYQTDLNELKGDLNELIINVGGNARLTPISIQTMLGTDGSTKTATNELPFYEFDNLYGSNKIHLQFENIPPISTHWFNQLDDDGNVLSYKPIYIDNIKDFYKELEPNCSKVKISIWRQNGNFKISSVFENNIEKNTSDIAENKADIAENKADIAELKGGNFTLNKESTNTMYDSSGNPKIPTSNLVFWKVNVINMDTVTVSCELTPEIVTHWYNEYDKDDNLIATVTKQTNNFTVIPSENCSYIKFSAWVNQGNITVTGYKESIVVSKEEIASGYTKLSAIGDSITYGYCLKDGVDSRVTNTYQRLIAERLGADYQNLGVSSTPICPNSDYTQGQNANAFVYRYSQIASDADLILVCGGTNDFRHLVPIGVVTDTSEKYEETFYGAVDYLINNIMLEHPSARLVFVSPFHQENDTTAKTTLDGETVHLSDYVEALRTKCEQYGVLFINAFSESGVSLRSDFVTRYMPDKLHPNDDGHVIIYKNLMHYFATL